MQVITQTEKYNIVAEVFKSLNSLRAFINTIEHFSDLEKMHSKFNTCFEEAKEQEARKKEEEENKVAKALEVKRVMEDMGLSIEDFNKVMLRSGNIGAVTLSDAQSEVVSTKAKTKAKATRANPVYVFEYEEGGVKQRTNLRPAIGRKPAGMAAYMGILGLNPYNTDDCLQLAVEPKDEEVTAYLASGGSRDLIQSVGSTSEESVEDTAAEDVPEVDVDNPAESFGNR
ncbi:hypothetical protein AB6Q85_003291 [Vibrio cholerae]